MFSLLVFFIDVFADAFNAAFGAEFWQYKVQFSAVLGQGIYSYELWHTGVQFKRFVP